MTCILQVNHQSSARYAQVVFIQNTLPAAANAVNSAAENDQQIVPQVMDQDSNPVQETGTPGPDVMGTGQHDSGIAYNEKGKLMILHEEALAGQCSSLVSI